MADPIVLQQNSTGGNGPAPKVNKEEETVAVPRDFLESIKETLEKNRIEIAELRKGQGELEKTASPDQIRKIEALRASGKLVKSVKISVIDGKLVETWQSTADEVYIDHALGKEVSRQMTKITFFDGKSTEYSQIDFARRKSLKEFEVIEEAKNREGELILTVMADDGKEIKINSRYIN